MSGKNSTPWVRWRDERQGCKWFVLERQICMQGQGSLSETANGGDSCPALSVLAHGVHLRQKPRPSALGMFAYCVCV